MKQSQEEERDAASISCPANRQRSPMKRDTVQLDLVGDTEVVPTQGPSVMDVAQKIQNGVKLNQ